MTKKWRIERGVSGGCYESQLLVEEETSDLIAEIYSATPDELELMRKAPELLNVAHDAYEELVLHEKMARSSGDEGLLAVLEKLRGLLF